MTRLEEIVEVQNLEMASTRASAASDPLPSYVQHTVLDTVHRLRPLDDARTICGIDVKASCKAQPHSQSHRRVNVKTYAPIRCLTDVPGILLCERASFMRPEWQPDFFRVDLLS